MSSDSEQVTPGAKFVRADLHVHTYSDGDTDPKPDLDAYVTAAVANGIDVLAITDHNSTRFVRDAIKAATGQPIVVIPGIEISTHDGHLLALFSADELDELESFGSPANLKLKVVSDTDKRSERAMLDLVSEIGSRGGLAIPAHVDVGNGMCTKLRQAELTELLTNPALAGLEFATTASLNSWFTDDDGDPERLAAWKARQNDPLLKDRGLARLMSSDAHSPEKVGRDRVSRTLTRLRVDEPNFSALRNAIQLSPKGRCKAEAALPAAYPRILRAEFKGGFLDGVSLSFTGNLNCLIGGRGSGKSTALLSIRAALGAAPAPGEDPDDPERMPVETCVTFIDSAGSERIAIRPRGGSPVDGEGSPIKLRMADLGQDESGQLARGYKDDPTMLLRFLDGFILKYDFDERETELLAELDGNASDVKRTSGIARQIEKLEKEESTLEGSLKAAKEGRIDDVAKWAGQLASQKPLLEDVELRLTGAVAADDAEALASLDELAEEFGVDLSVRPTVDFVDGEDGLRATLTAFDVERASIQAKASKELATAAEAAKKSLSSWKAEQAKLEERLATKRAELEAQGLKVQAGAIVDIANRLTDVKKQLIELRRARDEHSVAQKARHTLLSALQENRDKLYMARDATLKRIAAGANKAADDLTIHVYFERSSIDSVWSGWLTNKFGFREPRVSRLARQITPQKFAQGLTSNIGSLLDLKDEGGSPFFTSEEDFREIRTWPVVFELQTMHREDRPRIEVQRQGESQRMPFDHLSAGQQRSVLLSLLLCAERSEPLVLDQPEDHLDGQYIAGAIVRHLEAAKEKRQVLIATHSANLVVLGDAELVVPMRVVSAKGQPYAVGAVDRFETRDEVLALLEGGASAYKKRGERYGFNFSDDPPLID